MLKYVFREPKFPIICNIQGHVLAAKSEISFVRQLTKVELFSEKSYDVIDIDGVRVDFPDGWGLLRPSNTQPVLVLRFEAKTEQRLEEIKELFFSKLEEYK